MHKSREGARVPDFSCPNQLNMLNILFCENVRNCANDTLTQYFVIMDCYDLL